VVHLQRQPRSRDLGSRAFSWIVRGDNCAGDLKRETVRGRFSVQLAVMGRSERLTKLLEDTTLVHRVFGILVDRAWFVEVARAASMI
jgi:hypothetical protein